MASTRRPGCRQLQCTAFGRQARHRHVFRSQRTDWQYAGTCLHLSRRGGAVGAETLVNLALSLRSQAPKALHPLETNALRLLIRQKLIAGRLPQSGIPRSGDTPDTGNRAGPATRSSPVLSFVMEGIAIVGDQRTVHFHVLCFYMWDDERSALGGRTDRDAP